MLPRAVCLCLLALVAPVCLAAQVAGIQQGTATMTGTGTLQVNIAAVDPARAFLIFQTRHNSAQPDDSTLRGELSSATTVDFIRVSNETSTMNISWYVVEYASGVNVQRGTQTQTSSTVDVTLSSPVASLSQAFVLHSKTARAGDTIYSQDDPVTVELRNTSQIRIRTETANTSHRVAWQVVEFTDPADITVYRGSTSLTSSGSTQRTVNIGATIDPTRTMVLASYRSDDDGADIDERTMRAYLPNTTQVRFERGGTGGDDLNGIIWQVVEFNDGTTTQSGVSTFTGGTAQINAPISALDPNTAVPMATVQVMGGQNMGTTTYDGNDIIGVTSFTTLFSGNDRVALQRSSTAGAATVNWQVLDFSAVMAAPPVQPDPLAYYAMDEANLAAPGDVEDATGNGYDGDPLGNADTVADGYVCRGLDVVANTSAAVWDGVDTNVDVDDHVGSRGTITLWYRSDNAWVGGPDRAIFDAAQGNKYFNATVDSAGRVTFGLEDTSDADVQFRTSAFSIAADTWVHLAWTWDLPANSYQIYVNGTLAASSSISTNNTLGELDTLYLGDNRTTYYPYSTPNSAAGTIDEVRIYTSVLSTTWIQADRDATHVCPAATADHFDIDHDGAGIRCLAESVTVIAEDAAGAAVTDYAQGITLDTGSARGTWTLTTGNGSFSDATADDGLATYVYDASDNGTATFSLSYPEGASPLNLTVFETSVPAIQDDDAEGTLPFDPSGFTLTRSELPNPPPNPINLDLLNFTAGNTFTVHVAAYGQTATDPVCGVIEAYAGVKALDAWVSYDNPSSGTLVPTLNTVAMGPNEAGATLHNLTFTAGKASFLAGYNDVGEIRFNLKDQGPAVPIRGASNGTVASPATFVVQPVPGNPGTTSATGTGFVAAGAPFSVTVRVENSLGSLTPNYGNEVPAEGIILSSVLVNPATGQNGTGDDGTIGNGTAFTGAGGVFSGTTFYWDEVGTMNLQAGVADAQYLSAGDVVGGQSGPVGRFYPAQFSLVSSEVVDNACGYTYADQNALTVRYRLEALNAQGTRTANYDENSMPGGTGNLAFHAENADSGANLGTRLAGITDEWRFGIYEIDTSLAALGRGATPDGPFTNLQLGVSLTGVLDGQVISGRDQNALTSGDCVSAGNCTSKAIGAAADVRYGRARVEEAFGPETQAMDVALRTEYWDGTRFITNADDNCSTYASGNVTLGNYTGGLPPVTATSPVIPASFSAGRNTTVLPLLLSAPGAGNTGSVDVTLGVPAWLQYDWSGTGDENPTGTATYGRYRGHDRIVYWREIVD